LGAACFSVFLTLLGGVRMAGGDPKQTFGFSIFINGSDPINQIAPK